MEIIFYNIVSIIASVLVVIYSVNLFKIKKLVLGILSNLLAACLLATGILGFMVPENYEFIVIMVMLVLSLGVILIYVLAAKNKKQEANK